MKAAGSALRWIADQVDPPRPHEAPPYPCRAKSAITDEAAEVQRREDAMSLMDDDTWGYLLLRVVDSGNFARVGVQLLLSEAMWPAVNETMTRIVLEAERLQHR
jgi:hypothetical protein